MAPMLNVLNVGLLLYLKVNCNLMLSQASALESYQVRQISLQDPCRQLCGCVVSYAAGIMIISFRQLYPVSLKKIITLITETMV